MIADGSNGTVVFDADHLRITHRGYANARTAGLHGENSLPLSSVTAIHFKSAGGWMNGYIQFNVLGSAARRSGITEATKDQNAVIFTKKQEPVFLQLKVAVERRCAELRASPGYSSSTANDLEQLASLVERGFLTRAEFDAKKRVLLGA